MGWGDLVAITGEEPEPREGHDPLTCYICGRGRSVHYLTAQGQRERASPPTCDACVKMIQSLRRQDDRR